jgi:hypothetical protein
MFSPKGDGHKDGHETERKSKYQMARDIPRIPAYLSPPLQLGARTPDYPGHIDGLDLEGHPDIMMSGRVS